MNKTVWHYSDTVHVDAGNIFATIRTDQPAQNVRLSLVGETIEGEHLSNLITEHVSIPAICMFTVLTVATLIVALPTGAAAQGSCKWYATTSLKQQQENERLGCGFSGPAWNSDLKAHMSWCNSVPPKVWKKSAQTRDKKLAECSGRAG